MRSVQPAQQALRRLRWLAAACALALAATPARAQVAAGYSEYYVPGDETDMRLIFNTLDAAGTNYGMHAVISVTAWSANTTVYYDHWEDGYDFDPANPAATADELVVLVATGDQRTFESANIPTNPRGTATYYDGGDRIYVAGGVVTVTRASWIEAVGVGNQSAAWEIYPVKPQLTTYVVPFGENLGFADFNRVFVLIQATADDTVVTVDINQDGASESIDWNRDGTADGTSRTLARGETILLDRISAFPGSTTTPLPTGVVIQGSQTLQVKFVAGNPGQTYCARGLSAFPRGFWTKDYYAPVDQPTGGGVGNTDYYLHNPHATPLTVAWESSSASGSFTIPALSTVSFRAAVGPVPVDSGLYLKGGDTFWGVGVGNAGGATYEWGYSLLPSTFLYTEHFLGWAPGAIPVDTAGNPGNQDNVGVFLTVAQDNTRVFVDFDNDGVADLIDADRDGTPESPYVTLDRLQTQFFYDPANAAGGGDLSRAHFWATGDFTMAYGENADAATTSTPSLDLGYIAIPGTDFVSLVLTVDKSVVPQVVPTAAGSVATFTIRVSSQKYTIDGVNVTDVLPAGWGYVVGTDTTTITRSDRTTITGAAADPAGAGTLTTLQWSVAQLGGNMAENQQVTITFTARTTTPLAAGTLSRNQVQAVGTRTLGSPSTTQTFTATDFAYVASGSLAIAKASSAPTPLYPGDAFGYTVTVTNPPGGTTLTGVSVYDAVPAGTTYAAGSGTVTCERAQNARDEFSAVAYANNNGTASWAGSWTETDALGGGATSGLVQVTGGALQLGRARNVRDEFTTAAYTNNNGSASWSGAWTETDAYGTGPASGGAGPLGGFARVTGGALQLRYALSTVGDQFAAQSYGLNTGSDDWLDDWTESGDDGSASTTGNQHIYVSSGVLRFDRATGSDFGVSRSASIAFGSDVTFSFVPTNDGLDSGEQLVAEYFVDGAGPTLLGTFDGGSAGTWSGALLAYYVPNVQGTTVTLRFRATGAWSNNNDEATIDNVQISYDSPASAAGTLVRRTANLAGATAATFSFSYAGANLDAGGDVVVVEASSDGTSFTTLETLNAPSGPGTKTYDLLPYASASTTIRLRVTSGFNAADETFSVDNVDITYQFAAPDVKRSVDLTGASSPQLTFAYAGANLEAADTLVVEASASAAGPFTTLATFAGTSASAAPPYDLTPYASATTTVRFRITGGYDAGNETFSVDNVDVGWSGTSTFASGSPPELLNSGAGCRIPPGGALTVTFGVTVDNPLASGIESITNTAATTSTQLPIQVTASVTNLVVNPSALSASVAGRVWFDADADAVQDVGEPGLANVEVTLKDRFGTPVATARTDANGRYLFPGIVPGTGYYVEVTDGLPGGVTQTFPVGRTDGRTDSFSLVAGQSYSGADLGYRSAASVVAIGDLVWVDADADALRDPGEIGLGGVTVRLYLDVDGNSKYDDGVDTLQATTASAPGGSYLFTGVPAGSTWIVIATTPFTPGAPEYAPTTEASYVFPGVVAGSAYLTADFGFRGDTVSTYTLADRVWLDTNGDGLLGGGERGISGVTVSLLDASQNVIGTTVTAADGTFTFSGLAGGGADYTVRLSDTGGLLADYVGTTSFAQARERAESNLAASVDRTAAPSFGFRVTRAIGDTLFFDLNGNGAQDAGENGIAGVVVTLYRDLNGNGAIDAGEPQVGGGITTDANGRYLFPGLANGNFIVSVPTPSGYAFTGPGSDTDAVTAGIQKRATMSGANVDTVDFGFQAPAGTARTISGVVWSNADGDAVVDAGEAGIAGVTLDVLSGNTVVATLTTDASGAWSVAGLAQGSYTVRVTDSAGVLTGYSPNYERTEGTTGPFDYQELVNASAGDVADVNFGFGRPVPTYAALASLTAYVADGAVTVEWRTSLEVGTAGFHLLRRDPASGEDVRLTERLVPGLLVHPQGGVYRFRDAAAPTEGALVYTLVEVDVRGRSRAYGPYSVALQPSPRALDERVAEELESRSFSRRLLAPTRGRQALLSAAAAERRLAARQRLRRQGRVLKVTTRGEGLHYVSAAAMAGPLGMTADRVAGYIRAGRLTLSHLGRTVPHLPDAAGTGTWFHAEAVASPWTDENAYWLTLAPSPAMGARPAPPAGLPADSFVDTLHAEQDVFPVLNAFRDPERDFWVWDFLLAGYDGLDAKSYTLRPKAVAEAATATLTLHLVGGTDTAPGEDHHVEVAFNGQPLGSVRFDGLGPFDVEFPFPASRVIEGDNVVEVRALLAAGVSESFVYVDSIDLAYERRYLADDDALSFSAVGGTDVAVFGFTAPDVLVFDVTVPSRPFRVTGYALSRSGDGRYGVEFGVPGAGETRRYEALLARRAQPPTSVTAWEDARLRREANAAEYVLVAPESLREAARSLASYRSGQGLTTMVVGLEDVYDEFNAGLAEPTAIRAFLRHATSRWSTPPRYVTLVGRGTWDYRDLRGLGDNLLPTLLVGSPDGLVASDVALADLSGEDGVPEVAIGRLPVITAAELADYVAKIQAHEGAPGGEWQRRVLLAADDPDAAGNFTADSDSVAALLPAGYVADRVHLDATTAEAGRQAVLQGLNDGVVAFNYIGHGGVDRLAQEDLLTTADVPSLANSDRLPVFLAMTCSAGNFAIPGYPSLGEAMLLRRDGGAFAVWAPSGLSENPSAVRLDQSFFAAAFGDGGKVVGDLTVRSLRELDTPAAGYMRYIYNLLGEPVSRLPE